MSDLITKFNIDLQNRINAVQERLDSLKGKTKDEAQHAQKMMHDYVETLERKIDEGKEKLDEAQDDIEDWVEDAQETVHNWKLERDINKLRKRLERAERYSEAAFEVALNAIEEAESAMVRVVIASGDLDVAKAENAA